ncbi:MAG: agmatine deiminase family protein [Methanomassiliicoccales archaeon]|nr:agmatine deiminase family protein [Methanomassiliicoccales archaeon]
MEAETPWSLGYRMPAEWERHEATWLSWPKNPLTFPNGVVSKVEDLYCMMVEALSGGEMVKVLVEDDAMAKRVEGRLRDSGSAMKNVSLLKIRSADVWIRDYGPTFLVHHREKKTAVKWRFNAWGGKYDDLMADDTTGDEVIRASGARAFRPGIVMEGGSIDVNGVGSVLTTEQCLLNKNRNPELSREQIERYLEQYIGTPNVIWLGSGIEGDDTDGHVDDFARFISRDTVVCSFSESTGTENRGVLERNLELLERAKDQDGRPLNVVKLPMPRPLRLEEEDRWLPASYANFYIGNHVVLLPVFKDPNDEKAVGALSRMFPGRKVVPIYAADLVYGYGGIHCVTQQEPA